MAIWYHFYTDESGVHNRPEYWIGGIKLTPERAIRFRRTLLNYLLDRKINHELKWNKVNNNYLTAYQEFISLFLKEDAPQFKALHVIKGNNWPTFGKNEEERFFKSYYAYFRKYASQNYRHCLTLDYKTSKWYRWKQLSYALNGKAEQNRQKGRYISNVSYEDSKNEILLQLSDVILGALAFTGNSNSPKGELSSYVYKNIDKISKYGSALFTIEKFTPEKSQVVAHH